MDVTIDLNYLAWMIGWGFVLLILAWAIITINEEMEEKKKHGNTDKLPDEKPENIPIS